MIPFVMLMEQQLKVRHHNLDGIAVNPLKYAQQNLNLICRKLRFTIKGRFKRPSTLLDSGLLGSRFEITVNLFDVRGYSSLLSTQVGVNAGPFEWCVHMNFLCWRS